MHQLFGEQDRFGRIVGNAEADQEIGEPHHPESQFPIGVGHFANLGQGESVHLNHIVEEPDSPVDVFGKLFPIEPVFVTIRARLTEPKLQLS